ncbi:MAG: molybdopterin-dependent oxidoreductase [Nitrospirota bacterium]|nr:molybdopterin-dependent oxidoreductase [Nitrospirota bacterium]
MNGDGRRTGRRGKISRRQALGQGLRWAGGLALAAVWPARAGATVLDKLFHGSARATPAMTPNDEFYVTSYRSPPAIRLNEWELAIKGLVNNPVTLRYPELLARPFVSETVTLECVGNSVAGDAIGTALWEGVPLKALLAEAGGVGAGQGCRLPGGGRLFGQSADGAGDGRGCLAGREDERGCTAASPWLSGADHRAGCVWHEAGPVADGDRGGGAGLQGLLPAHRLVRGGDGQDHVPHRRAGSRG